MENPTRKPRLFIVAAKLKEQRLRNYLTPEKLSRRADVSVGVIRSAESNKPRAVHLGTVQKLAEALGCDPQDISEVREPERESA